MFVWERLCLQVSLIFLCHYEILILRLQNSYNTQLTQSKKSSSFSVNPFKNISHWPTSACKVKFRQFHTIIVSHFSKTTIIIYYFRLKVRVSSYLPIYQKHNAFVLLLLQVKSHLCPFSWNIIIHIAYKHCCLLVCSKKSVFRSTVKIFRLFKKQKEEVKKSCNAMMEQMSTAKLLRICQSQSHMHLLFYWIVWGKREQNHEENVTCFTTYKTH